VTVFHETGTTLYLDIILTRRGTENSKEIDSVHHCTRNFEIHVKANEFHLKPSN
jgi:hypothetical protein